MSFEKKILDPRKVGRKITFTLPEELTNVVEIAGRVNGDKPDEFIQKAIAMYANAIEAKVVGLHCGAATNSEKLTQKWLY